MSKNFITLTATYRIVMPMFCAGADQQKAELRLPSFKGALRFWWRSLMWGKARDVAELRRKEAELFGSSDQNVGQSKARMRFKGDPDLKKSVCPPEVFESGRLPGCHYLGYGVMEAFPSRNKGTKAGQLTRPMIPGGEFTVQLRLGPRISDEQRQQIENALVLLGTVGGLGSKSRKGFGSLTLTSLKQDDHEIELKAGPIERIKAALGALPDGEPEWTAWSQQSRVLTVFGNSKSTAVGLLDKLGREQVYFRSWGNQGRVIDRDSERNFKEDHDLSKGKNVAISHPRRLAFGLPHNYGKGDSKAVAPASRDIDRRASPLFLHVHQASEQEAPIGVVAFLPSLFLPKGEEIQAFGKTVPLDRSDEFWNPIHGYLDRLIGKGGATAKQTDLQAKEVKLG